MKNTTLIKLTQNFPAWLRLTYLKCKKNIKLAPSSPVEKEIKHFGDADLMNKRALLSFHPAAWRSAVSQSPNIKLYNHNGFLYDLVYALNTNGYIVDFTDPNTELKIEEHYDLFIGHGGNCVWILDQLGSMVKVAQYISGLYWKQFLKESNERYERFYADIQSEQPDEHRRSIIPLAEGLEVLNNRADVLFSLNCPRMVEAYGKNSHKFYFTGLGAFTDPKLELKNTSRDFEAGKKNFIYVGGSGGNLQKGLDLMIEAFAEMPEYQLYIYCKVEEEVMEHLKKKLNSKNIHYIYHWRYDRFDDKLNALLKNINFSLHAPINTGIGTAFSGTMAVGMIPVGYIDLYDYEDFAVLSNDCSIDSLKSVIKTAAGKDTEWCKNASKLSKEYFANNCAPEAIKKNLTSMVASIDSTK